MDKRMLTIMVILVTIFIGFGMIIPVLPNMIEDAQAATYHLGLMLSLYSAMSFFLSPLWGAFSDRIGRRPIIMIGVFGFSLSFFLFGISDQNLWVMYASRLLGGAFSGAATACCIAYVADITSEDNRTKGMGLAGMSIGLGFIFGPAFGGLLSVFGNELPFFAASALSLGTLIFAWFVLKESHQPKEHGQPEVRESRWKAFAGPLKHLYILSFLVSFTLAGLESTLQFFQVAKIGASAFEMGMMFAISGVAGAVIQGYVVRKKIKKGMESKAILIGLLVSGTGFILILFSVNFWTAALYVTIFGIGNALIRPCVTSLVTQKTTVGQGVASGLISSMDSLGRILGPLIGSLLFYFDITYPFLFGGAVLFMAISLVYSYRAADRKFVLSKVS
ncbi:MFS transporter [Ammoniphilus sp. YIM 78166]|uniref:MFS transporter n=1 Tax=Ammoniphilus sp. YIM 78166 TaxID=1644106 RepID=UPI00106F9D0C|nr:MFS transporter [Ammoniphilus sp. YIM 78166]